MMKKTVILLFLTLLTAGCSTGVQSIDQTVSQVKEAANSEIKAKLQAAVQAQIDLLKSQNPQIVQIKMDWEQLKNTELGQQSFFTAFGYEYLAKVRADGTVQVVQRNNTTGEEKVYKEYKLLMDSNGQVQVQ